MKLVATDTPQSDRDLALWMEQKIVSPHFAQWVAELAAVNRVESTNLPYFDFEMFVNDRISQIADYGLMCLSRGQMCQLLSRPEHLLHLQKQIFARESDYWSNLFDQQNSVSDSERERTNIALYLGPEAVVLARQGRNAIQTKSVRRFSLKTIVLGVASVAVITMPIGYWMAAYLRHQHAISAAWDWQAQIQSMPINTPKEFFETLAQQADDWFKIRPSNMAQLKTRVAKLQGNLSNLINDRSAAISGNDRNWLKQSSTRWLAKCDALLKTDRFDEALRQADELCVHMIDELHRRADAYNR